MSTIATDQVHVYVMQAEPVLALGLAAALRQQPGLTVCMACPDTSLPYCAVIVADYATAMQLLRVGRRDLRVVLMSTLGREQEVRVALEAGVRGYLLLGCSMDELAEAVRVVAQGAKYLCRSVAERMADSLTRERLTGRELDVLQLLSGGNCNKSIARDLDIAVGTVKAHVKAIMSKLEAHSRTQAVAIASQRGLVAELATTGFGGALQSRAASASRLSARERGGGAQGDRT